ncbi:hypothetical protein MJN54_08970, partial [Salmonella enterica subsp. enterica serovar Kentucky]|nr:hypothetical protein [Salmonella enterica subsp. enterica serovar Kentucky]
ILIAHGATTATSQAQYVNRVLERELFSAIDMPFEQSVHDTLEFGHCGGRDAQVRAGNVIQSNREQ